VRRALDIGTLFESFLRLVDFGSMDDIGSQLSGIHSVVRRSSKNLHDAATCSSNVCVAIQTSLCDSSGATFLCKTNLLVIVLAVCGVSQLLLRVLRYWLGLL
jgi:hypothetical protein